VDAAARLDVIRRLCSFERRLAGTDAERRAANWLAEHLREGGRSAELEPTYVHPQFALVHAAHCVLGVAGSLVAIASPPAGFAIVLLTAVSMYLDLNARQYLLRRLFFRRASQNVVSPGRTPGAPARLFLCAHYDTARTGTLYRPAWIGRFMRMGRLTRAPFGPFRVLFWSLALLLPILGARMAGLDSGLISLLQLIPTLILLAGAFMLVDVQLSAAVPGANDNASGVATALALAGELDARPPDNLDVALLLTGAEECQMEGARAFARARGKELDRKTTYFLNLDAVGRGALRYVTSEGLAVSYPMDRRLIELCSAIASADREQGDRVAAQPLARGLAGDGAALRRAGFRVLTITTLEEGALVPANYHRPDDVPERVDGASLDRAHDFALQLVRALDRDVGRRLAG
jgi:acetylornithine deacetylase/succinyl-diaminopimelate desuccinylase-like protein